MLLKSAFTVNIGQIEEDWYIYGQTSRLLKISTDHPDKVSVKISPEKETGIYLSVNNKKGIFISQDKYVNEILRKFNYTDVKSASTPTDLEKPLVQDGDAADVNEHLYRSMIGSLMYLKASRPDIMFAVCACARFQVSPKTSHLLAVKRIFRYLKGKPSLGLWYSKDSSLELVAYTDNDYAEATQARKSTTGGCQFLGSRLISWQCKKQTIVATSTTKAEYVAAASCCGQVSSDPFNIYDLLDKRTKEVRTTDTSTSIPYPPGFTPANDIPASNNQDIPEAESVRPPSRSARSNSRVLEEAENSVDRVSSESFSNGVKIKEGGSILEILEEMITVGQTMGFSMEGLGSKAKKDWIKELISKHKVSFLSIQETKMESVSAMEVKFLWGNYFFDHIISEASGNSGGILCAWDTNFFKKDHHTISDNFIALYGTWIPNNQKLLIISVYAPQSVSSKRMLWSYLESLITSWNGESLIMGDFNEVRCIEERWGSVFNSHGANAFNSFISNSGLNDIQLEGFSFTWVHPSATKMSKLDRFLMSNGLLSAFPLISAICLDRHLSDHRPILLKEVFSDFGPTPFRFYHSWLELPGFDDLVSKFWNSFTLDDSNGMIRFKKKLQMLKKEIRAWTLDFKRHQVGLSKDLKSKLCDIDKVLDQGGVTDDILLSRLEVLKQLHDVQSFNNHDIMQKAKIRWAI
ncbi:RNA-directed DNA polymerase, eukaryota [Tanacetum coccineum]